MKHTNRKLFAVCGAIAVLAVVAVIKAEPAHQVGAVTTPVEYPNDFSALGTNMPPLNYYSSAIVFKDIFKQSSENWTLAYIAYTTDPITGKAAVPPQILDRDENGWIKSLPAGVLAHRLVKSGTDFVAGDYTVLYDGEGTIDFEQDAKVVSREPGKVIARVTTPKVGIKFKLTATNPNNYVRNVRMIAPGTDANGVPFTENYNTEPFHPDFLDQIKKYRVLRFMDSQVINRSPNAVPADINSPLSTSQGGVKGIAPEYIAMMSNAVHADAWVNIPHLATDEYVREFATRIRDTLDPSLRVYIEYSNEMWNFAFSQTGWAREQAIARGYGSCYNCFYAMRSREIFDIFEEVFGGRNRLVRIFSTQSANSAVTRSILTFRDSYQYGDVLAIAPYFNWRNIITDATTIPTMDPDVFMDKVELMIDTVLRPEIQKQKDLANQYNLRMISYEGGQHLAMSSNVTVATYLTTINRMPRMKDLYEKYLNMWKEMGGHEFVHFTHTGPYSKFGNWGSLESSLQDPATAPKYQALMEFIDANPPWWDDNRMSAPETEFRTDEDTAVTIMISGRGVTGFPVEDVLTQAPEHGTLSGVLPAVTYTPDRNFHGIDTFTYAVPWTGGQMLSPTVTVTVSPVADQPSVNTAYLKLWPNNEYRGALTANDPDSQMYTLVQKPLYGSITLESDGSYTYTPKPDYKGPDVFYYKVSSADGTSGSVGISLSVQPTQDANTYAPYPIVGTLTRPVSYSSLVKALTNEGHTGKLTANTAGQTYTIVQQPRYGVMDLNPDGTFVYTPHQNFSGTDTLIFRVTTPSGVSGTATVTLRVAPNVDPASTYPPQ